MRLAMKALLAAALAASSLGAWAQSYPTRPVTLVVPFAAGGPTDVVARTLAAAMTKTMGQTVVVEHKLGEGGFGAVSARRRPPTATPCSSITTVWRRRRASTASFPSIR